MSPTKDRECSAAFAPREASAASDSVGVWLSPLVLATAITVLIRFPFFFPSEMGWDESTYIIMGQALLEGHLPYTKFWVLKPPIAFCHYAIFAALGGRSVLAVRLGGTVEILLAAGLAGTVARRLSGNRAGWWATLLTPILVTAVRGTFPTLTGHLLLAPLNGALLAFAATSWSPRRLMIAGCLMMVTALTRLELAYCAVLVGVAIVFARSGDAREKLGGCAWYALGGLIPIAVLIVVYAMAGEASVLWPALVRGPLAYARSGLEEGSGSHFSDLVALARQSPSPFCAALAGLAMLGVRRARLRPGFERSAGMLVVVMFGSVISAALAGRAFQHYALDLAGVAAIVLAVGIGLVSDVAGTAIAGVAVVLSLAPLVTTVDNSYRRLISTIRSHGTPYADVGYWIADYVREHGGAGQPAFFLSYHVAYWLADADLPTRFVHPSCLRKAAELGTAAEPTTEGAELEHILAQQPRFITVAPFAPSDAWEERLRQELDAHYERIALLRDGSTQDVELYQRAR